MQPATLLQAVNQLHGTFPWGTYICSFRLLKIYLARPLTFFFLRGDFLTCVLPGFLFAARNDCLIYYFSCIHMTVYWYVLLFRRKTPQYNLLLLTVFSVPECLYTLRMMANNYGLLWSLATAVFFLPKDQKKTDEWCCYYSSMLYEKKTQTHVEWSLRQLLKIAF